MFGARYLHDIEIALESIRSNKLRSFLTGLGIVFGVAAVISMLAIGGGARKEILEQMRRVGVNNIVVEAIRAEKGEIADEEGEKAGASKRFSPGLTLRDAEVIRHVIPSVRHITPEVTYDDYAQSASARMKCQITGINEDYLSIYNLRLERGEWLRARRKEQLSAVCVIGSEVRARLFSRVDPLGQRLRIKNAWFEVVGVLMRDDEDAGAESLQGVGNYNRRIFVGISALALRYKRRGALSKRYGALTMQDETTFHEADRLVMQVDEAEHVPPTCEVVNRILLRRHQGVEDFRVVVPEELLRQQQRTKEIFNLVLGLIAGISLLVGGIGIMNIMFATVMERIKEIGIRLAVGAKRRDIVVQFLAEAVLIGVSGGLLGVLLGVASAVAIRKIAGIEAVLTGGAMLVAFGVSVAVGIIFGYAPARRAAGKSPMESLHHE